jgi:O-antigen ligase
MPHPSRSQLHNAKMVESFRGDPRSTTPLHPAERLLVILASLHLCFLPWALGARAPWAQLVSAALGLAALGLALLPRRYGGELAPQGPFVLHTWPRLLRFPGFWLGLGLLVYVGCQALNPAFIRASAGPYWWLAQRPSIEWLPSGVAASFSEMNAWRMMAIWGGAWALGCALWIGVTRRTSVHGILSAIVANGALLALVGILQKVTEAREVLWFITPPANYFVATFFYKNHAGAYLNLVLALALLLMAWHHVRALRRLERSSPAPVYAFAAVVLVALVFMSASRTAMILCAGYLLVCGVVYLIWRLRAQAGTTHPAVAGLVGACSLALVVAAAWFLNLDRSIDQFRQLTTDQGQKWSIESRILARQATMDLFEERPTLGWGAGSFRHAFPLAQRNYDPIFNASGGRTYYWDHAHNDYVQALAELGWVGFLFPLFALCWMFWRALRQGATAQPAFAVGLIGLGLPLAHAWVDFPLSNCAILVTFCAALVLLTRWTELEGR